MEGRGGGKGWREGKRMKVREGRKEKVPHQISILLHTIAYYCILLHTIAHYMLTKHSSLVVCDVRVLKVEASAQLTVREKERLFVWLLWR